MPTDPKHGRYVPSGRKLGGVLRRIFVRMGQAVAVELRAGRRPRLGIWALQLVEIVRPLMLREFARGSGMMELSIRQRLAKGFSPRTKAGYQQAADFSLSAFDLLRPEVLLETNTLTFQFVAATLATAQGTVDEAYEQFRTDLTAGLAEGEPLQRLNRRVQETFDDPMRAMRIAQTEASRAMHAGQMAAARESGIVQGFEWLASSDACEHCLALDGQTRPLGSPFFVDPRRRPLRGLPAPAKAPPLYVCRKRGNRMSLQIYAPPDLKTRDDSGHEHDSDGRFSSGSGGSAKPTHDERREHADAAHERIHGTDAYSTFDPDEIAESLGDPKKVGEHLERIGSAFFTEIDGAIESASKAGDGGKIEGAAKQAKQRVGTLAGIVQGTADRHAATVAELAELESQGPEELPEEPEEPDLEDETDLSLEEIPEEPSRPDPDDYATDEEYDAAAAEFETVWSQWDRDSDAIEDRNTEAVEDLHARNADATAAYGHAKEVHERAAKGIEERNQAREDRIDALTEERERLATEFATDSADYFKQLDSADRNIRNAAEVWHADTHRQIDADEEADNPEKRYHAVTKILARPIRTTKGPRTKDASISATPKLDLSAMTADFIVSTPALDRDWEIMIQKGIRLEDFAIGPAPWFFNHQQLPFPIGSHKKTPKDRDCPVDVWPSDEFTSARCHFNQATPEAEIVFRLVELGHLGATSIGFHGLKFTDISGEEARQLGAPYSVRRWDEWALVENSIVGTGANPEAITMHMARGSVGKLAIPETLKKAFAPYCLVSKAWANGAAIKVRDDSGHEHAADGRFGSGGSSTEGTGGGGSDSSVGDKPKPPRSILGRVKEAAAKVGAILKTGAKAPLKAVKKAKAVIGKMMKKIETRYGGKVKKAVSIACLIALPLPIPGASAALIAPILAFAEIHKQIMGKEFVGELKAEEMSEEKLKSIARKVLVKLFGGKLPPDTELDAIDGKNWNKFPESAAKSTKPRGQKMDEPNTETHEGKTGYDLTAKLYEHAAALLKEIGEALPKVEGDDMRASLSAACKAIQDAVTSHHETAGGTYEGLEMPEEISAGSFEAKADDDEDLDLDDDEEEDLDEEEEKAALNLITKERDRIERLEKLIAG